MLKQAEVSAYENKKMFPLNMPETFDCVIPIRLAASCNVDLGTVQSVSADNTDTKAYCPMCGKPLFTSPKVMGCKACPFRLFPQIAGKTLTATQIEALLMRGKTGVIKGFRSKAGKSFDALLRLFSSKETEIPVFV